MTPATLARLAVAGTRTDTVRITLTALASAMAVLAWLSAATVASLGLGNGNAGSDAWNLRYRSDLLQQPGLRPGVVTALILLTVPVLAFAGQCARLGAPARDRRLAALRLAGATPGQAVAVAAGETGVAAAIGSAAGLGVYFLIRALFDHPDANGQLGLPVDVLPPAWSIGVIGAGLPLVAALAATCLMRKVIVTPLGVTRRERRKRAPRPWPGAMVLLALVIFAGFNPLLEYAGDQHWRPPHWLQGNWIVYVILYGGAIAAMLGVCFSSGWIAYTAGRLLRRFGTTASTQLAGARLMDDPWSGSRAMAVILVAAVFGGGAAAFYANIQTQHAVELQQAARDNPGMDPAGMADSDSFYVNTLKLIAVAIAVAMIIAALGQLISIAEAIVSRRRAYASLVATGVPRATLMRTALWQALAVAAPAVAFGAVVGVGAMRLFGGASVTDYDTDGVAKHVTAVPWPWAQMGLTFGVAIAAVLVTTSIGLVFMKSSTSVEELRTP